MPIVNWQILPCADYIVHRPNKELWLERKTISDFLSSIGDGRLFRQSETLVTLSKNEGAVPLILLEGSWTPVETIHGWRVSVEGRKNRVTGYSVGAFAGALLSVQEKGVKILTSKNADSTVKIISALAGVKELGRRSRANVPSTENGGADGPDS